jgi:hypothetical protein
MGVRVGVCVAGGSGVRVAVTKLIGVKVVEVSVCGSAPKQPGSKSISNIQALTHREREDLGMG